MNKRCVCKQKEELAAEFLIGRGVKIIDKNFACKDTSFRRFFVVLRHN